MSHAIVTFSPSCYASRRAALMLARPDVADDALRACLRAGWGLDAVELRFVPLGADAETAAFRATGVDGTVWFVKLRRESFDPVSVEVPALLHECGVTAVIPPIPSRDGARWRTLGPFVMVVSAWIEGVDALARPLDLAGLRALGAALRQIHETPLPDDLRRRLPRETFSDAQRERVRRFLALATRRRSRDPIAARAATLLHAERESVLDLLASAAARAARLRTRASAPVLCHADLHAWNLLVAPDGTFRIIDWDTVILAPRERDLMMPGSGIGRVWSAPEEIAAFHAGYGRMAVDVEAIAYFREERIVSDIAADCELLLADGGGAGRDDRERALGFLASSFGPDGLIALTRARHPAPDAARAHP